MEHIELLPILRTTMQHILIAMVLNIPKEIAKLFGRNIIVTIFRIQDNFSVMWEYFCIGCINFNSDNII